jgi:hypothetical protein
MSVLPIASTLIFALGLSGCMERVTRSAEAGGLDCHLDAEAAGGQTTWTARIEADSPVTGTYDLRLVAGGARVEQAGPFALAPGDSAVLGQAVLPTVPAPREARLVVTIAGQDHLCPQR